jgi:hypothetical protein
MRIFHGELWVELSGYTLVFLMAVFPMIFELAYVEAFLFLIVIAAAALAALNTGTPALHPTVILWTLFLSTMGFFFILEGFVRGSRGASAELLPYVIFPIIYGLAIAGVRSDRILARLVTVLLVSAICIAFYSIWFLLIETRILPENRFMDFVTFDWDPTEFAQGEGFIRMQLPGVNSMPFLAPFVFALLGVSFPSISGSLLSRRVWQWVALMLAMASVLVSGRRALYLVILAAPIFTALFSSFLPTVQRSLSRKSLLRVTAVGVLAVVVLVMCVGPFFGVSMNGMAQRIAVGFDFSDTAEQYGAMERRVQFDALLHGWLDDPLLGVGLGTPAHGSIRSQRSPWNYELHYMALLYQTGLLGVTAYTAGIFWIYWTGVRVIRAGGYLAALMVPCLVGMTSVLIANATNPYLARIDGLWAIFIPLAVINYWLLQRNRPNLKASNDV